MTMKKVLLPLALVAVAAGLVQSTRQIIAAPAGAAGVMETIEAAFPLDTPVPVDLQTPSGASELLTTREMRDQMRDWLLLTVLTNAGLEPETLNEVTFDLPPVRYGFMKGVADWEFGDVRSRAVGNGTVVALIPANAGMRRADYLADVADQSRKNLGQRPARLVVVEYEIDNALSAATLTRRATVDGDTLFTEAAGYIERSVTTIAEFEQFQRAVDDLTYAAVRDDALRLGGRRIPGRPIRGVRTEDVAALWQAELKLSAASTEYERFVKQKQDELEGRWKNRTYSKYEVGAEARLRRELEADQAAVAEEILALRKKLGVSDALGFSLDPAYDYPKMASFVELFLPAMPVDRAKLTKNDHPLSAYRDLAALGLGGRQSADSLPAGDVAKVAAELRDGRTRLFFEALQQLKGNAGEAFYQECEQRFGLQAARYDGDLQGTEPGMVLFYTDLLAKLWAIDYLASSNSVDIEDFVPLTKVKLSPVFRKELQELRHTRLWFGPQNKGFQISADKEVFLSRVATRLYAASATSLKQGEESAPNAQTAAFLGWWDDHYEEVARFEPEYERLNQIMKWSLVLGWLHQNADLSTLAYLQTVRVSRDHWFPDWARRHHELRFQRWETINFYPRGSFGVTTEALPRLRGPEYEQFGEGGHFMSGGVSLASRATFAERPLLSTRVAEGLRRANVRYAEMPGTGGFKTLEGVEYNFTRTLNRYEVTIKPEAGLRFRGRVGELANQSIRRTVEARAGGVEYCALAGEAQIGSLGVTRTGNGFKVGWAGRDLDAGYALGRRLSTTRDLAGALGRDRQVLASSRLPDGTYVARVRGSDRWVRFAEETQASSKIDGEWQARVAGYEPGARSVKMQWVDEAWVKGQVGDRPFEAIATQVHGKVNPGDELVDLMARRDLRSAARQIAGDPVGMHAKLEAAYRADLAQADDLIRTGSPAEVSEHVAQMERAWGPTPDISARRAIALVDHNDLSRAARTIEGASAGPARNLEAVYKELALRIERSAGRPSAETWEALSSATEWKASGAAGRPAVVVNGDHLTLEYHLSRSGKGQSIPVDRAARSRAPIYVQDSPQLRNLDWSADVQRTMQQAVDGDLATIVRLPDTDVAHFRPAKIYGPGDATVLKRVESPDRVGARAIRTGYRAYSSSECHAGDSRAPSTGPTCPEERQAVYLVVPKGSERHYE
jgi:hypothetical protein